MTNFIIHMLKSGILLGLFYGLYFVLFRKETLYQFTRYFLLGSLLISLIIPGLDIRLTEPLLSSENSFDHVNHAFINISETVEYVKVSAEEKVGSTPLIPYLVIIGMLFAAVHVGFQLVSIYRNIKKYEIREDGKYKYVLIDQYYSTHSFFNYIFVHKSEFSKNRMHEVLVHEHMHANQLHSLDLLLVGFLTILQWFNPFIYLFKRALVETHEFQADQEVINQGIDKNRYQGLLLQHARSVVMTGLTSSFNQSIIKKRLKMMNKRKSSSRAILKYLMAFPIVFLIGTVFAISQDKIEKTISESMVFKDGRLSFGYQGKISYSAEDSISMDVDNGLVALYGNASVITQNNALQSDIIFITKEEVFAYNDENTPSLTPVDKEKLKRLSSGFGMRMHPILKIEKMHYGCDFSAPMGTEIYATANGVVRKAEFAKNYGNRVIIDHGNGYSTSYSQMENYIVKAGQSVKKGEVIGYVGSTGMSTAPHLHYEVMKDGKYVDPEYYLE